MEAGAGRAVFRLRIIRTRENQFFMTADDDALNRLYELSVPFRLYAEHANGMSLLDLALVSSRPVEWVRERVEAMRLCLEKQVYIDVSAPASCPESMWVGQVWD